MPLTIVDGRPLLAIPHNVLAKQSAPAWTMSLSAVGWFIRDKLATMMLMNAYM